MNELANENEQWEAVKSWWQKNGTQTIVLIIIAIMVGFGWRYWQTHQLKKKEEASQLFDQLLSVQAADPSSAMIDRITDELEKKYPSTPYASSAALFSAKSAVLKDDLPAAAQKLQWALDHAKTADLRDITRIRLARVLLAEKKPDAAMAVLEKIEQKGFSAAVEQVTGDIYSAQGQTAKAHTAYQDALNAIPPSEAIRPYVEMQLNQ